MSKWMRLVLCAGLVLLASSALAEGLTILNFDGFLYESDNAAGVVGFPPSDPGDVLAGVGLIAGIDPPLSWSTTDYLYSWAIEGLVSTGAYDMGGGESLIVYNGGTLEIVAQAYAGPGYTVPDYGVEPPNSTAPATFIDGNPYLHGVFTSFYMVYNTTTHTGHYEGTLNFTLGSNLGELVNPYGYTLAGTVDPVGAITIPTGYDLEAVGHVDFDSTIPVSNSTWGDVKNLYR
ncbi:MAG: hypothetical protein ACYDIE_02050 [Candidatus Krumholzibacteriia bacterium]